MDRVTQLQDSIQQTAILMVDCLYYLNIRSSNPEITPETPVSIINEAADPSDVFDAKRKDFVNKLVRQVQQTNALIESLPRNIEPGIIEQPQQSSTSAEDNNNNNNNSDAEVWNKLNADNLDAAIELQQASQRARSLVDRVSKLILFIANKSSTTAAEMKTTQTTSTLANSTSS